MNKYEITKCRACGSEDLKPIISLGEQYVSNFVDSEEEQGEKIPLELVLCEECKLLQLKHNAPANLMWNTQYWYRSSISPIIKNDLKDIVSKAEQLKSLKDEDIVIDIGNNDGTMFDYYKNRKLTFVGFEPCLNVANEAKAKGYEIINDFFNAKSFKEKYGDKKAQVITAISMFYDLEDPNKFLEDIKECLKVNGLFIIQQNYALSMLQQNAFCNICHEHREFYTLQSLIPLLDKHGLEVFDIELNDINGGSIRTYIRVKGSRGIIPFKGSLGRVYFQEKLEKEMKLDTPEPYQKFASRIDIIKKRIVFFLKKERAKGKTIAGCGASTRGNTILQYFGITPDLISCLAEANPDKWGKKTVGSLIPIISIDEMKKVNPDYQFVVIWHLYKGLRNKEKSFLEKGGKFIIPLPEFKVISKEDEK
jgi:SAM-dependent methyltransferase